MEKSLRGSLQLIALFGVLIVGLCVNGVKAEAYSWSTTFGNSSKVIKVGDDVPVFDPEALNLQLVEGDNELQIYNKNGVLRATYPMYKSNNYIWIYKNETFKITKVGVKDGRYVDLLLKNISLIEGSNADDLAFISTTSNGRIGFYKKNQINNDEYSKFLNMKLIDHETSQELPNQRFYMNSYVPSIDYSYGRFIGGYDKQLTTNYLFPVTDTFLTNNVALDTTTSSTFDYMTAKGRNTESQGYFSIYGSTGASGYSLGLASGINAASAIFFFDPNDIAVIPNAYPPLRIVETASQNEDVNTATFTMTQDLPMQRNDTYIPANDSFKLSISEENTDFLTVTKDDFELSVGGNAVPSTAYTLNVAKQGTTTGIDITFTTAYLKSLNTATTGSNSVEIKQTSAIINDQGKMTAAISDYLFTMPFSANLTYTFANGISKGMETPHKDVSLNLTPPLAADLIADVSAKKGTVVGDIPVEDLITKLRNQIYAWDTVTVSFDDPTSVLDTVGDISIPLTLKSQTFGNISQINAMIHVKDFSLTYDANGGEGTAPPATSFDQGGILLANQGELTKPKYLFEGWSTSADGSTKIYKPGDLYGTAEDEAKDTTLYAIWKKQFYDMTTSWSESDIIKSTKQTVDRSQTTLAMAYYWQTTGHASYEVNLMLNNEVLASNQVSNTNDQQVMTKENLTIPIDRLTAYGDNALDLQFYQLDAKGEKMSQEPNDTLKVTINIDGSLQFKSVPEGLKWTGRTIDQTKGIINRDQNNEMAIQVLDSRNVKDADRSWYVRASLTTKETVPFSFVWKQDVSSTAVPLKDAVVPVMSTSNAEKESDYVYGDKWNNDEGILLSSDAYLSIGDYSNKVAISWNLYDVKGSE